MKILLIDIAWTAGLIEGEGSFGWHGRTPKVVVQMTDKDTIEKLAGIWGSKVYGPYGPYGVSTKVTYTTAIYGSQAIGWMMTMFVFMSERRKQKIEEIIAAWKPLQMVSPKRRPHCHPEGKYFAKSMCRPCYMKDYHAHTAH